MPDTNTPTNDQVIKIISLDNLETYTGYVERKGIDITYAEYQQLTPAEKQGKTFYIIDYPDSVIDASGVIYDNTESGLESENAQDAIDELKDLIDQGGGGTQVQSDWDESSSSSPAFIKNKPTLGTASSKDVPSSGNASTSQVVMGSDTRLSDSRPASDVSAWAKASTKPSYTASEVGAIATTAKGANNGVAELDSTGKVPSSQLPSYVDDVIEYDSLSDFPLTSESGKIYIAKDTNTTYRWSGTAYVAIGSNLALGETSSTAYRGDRGKIAYDHSQVTSGNPHNVTKSEVGLGNVTNDKQIVGLASGTTEDHVVTFGTDGYSVKDSGKTLGTSVPSDAVFTDTTYSAASNSGITLNANTNEFSNSGVRSVAQGTTNGTVSVNTNGTTTDVAVKGLGNAAYTNGGQYWATCNNQAANQKKTVTVSSDQNFVLEKNAIIFVKFDAANTYTATAEAPVKLNVNGTGDKNVYYANTNAPTGTNTTAFGRQNYINQYIYDGTNWVWQGSSSDNDTTNKVVQTVTTGNADYEVLFSNTADNTTRTEGARKNNNLKFNPSTGNLQTTKINGVTVGNSPKFTDTVDAASLTYSNTTSGLSATKVQGAIDELNSLFDALGLSVVNGEVRQTVIEEV